jgi:valyl-tRNA synthetase
LTRFTATVQEVNKALENFDLGQAGSLIYEFIWNEFCDWYIELAKGRLYAKDNHRARYTAQVVLHAVLKGTMELLHPFMPFITEEIYQHLPGTKGTVMLARFPRGIELGEEFAAAEQNMGLIMEVIKGIRNIRAEMNVPLGKKAEVILVANSPSTLSVIEEGQQFIKQLASASELTIHLQLAEKPEQAGTAIVGMVEVYVPLAGAIDLDKEITRLEKELDSMQKEIQRAESKLNNQGFVAKAPVEVIDKEREKLVGFIAKRQALEERIEGLKK